MNKTIPTPYPELNEVLEELVGSIREILAGNFVGAYLQGSFATGDFDEHSDVDFAIVVNREITKKELAKLQVMHGQIYDSGPGWAQHLEGSYFPKAILRSKSACRKKLWYLDNGRQKLERSTHCNTILVRWVLYEKGITLAGPPAKTLVEKISHEVLREDIFKTINKWGREILANPDKFRNRFYQSFIVLSYCRMLHDLINGTNDSKRAGAEWAKKNLDSCWLDLIDRTWAARPKPEITFHQPADPEDFARTLEFVKYIILESKRYRMPEKPSAK